MKVEAISTKGITENQLITKDRVNRNIPSFLDLLAQKIREVDASQKEALSYVEALARGEEVDLSEVALTISKADLNLKLLLRIRNKVLEAYNEIMRLQI